LDRDTGTDLDTGINIDTDTNIDMGTVTPSISVKSFESNVLHNVRLLDLAIFGLISEVLIPSSVRNR
jgi:hypothetical protein